MKREFPCRSFFMTFARGLLAIAMIAPQAARGQLLQGSIDGNVTDASQGAIAGARVVATDQGTGFVRETQTGSTGFYSLPNLPPGTYTVTVRSHGFQTYSRTGVLVTVQTVTRVDANLNVGALSESVTVSAQEVALQADRADVRSEISAASVSTNGSRTTRSHRQPAS